VNTESLMRLLAAVVYQSGGICTLSAEALYPPYEMAILPGENDDVLVITSTLGEDEE